MFALILLATLSLTPHETAAMHHLMTTRTFEYPAVGDAAVESQGWVALRVLVHAKDADAAFKELVAHAAPAGQLYGLIGVSRTDPAFFRANLDRYKQQGPVTSVANGCEIMSEQVATIVYDSRAIQLPAGTTLDVWLKEHPRKSVFLDIAGGGLISMFLDSPEP